MCELDNSYLDLQCNINLQLFKLAWEHFYSLNDESDRRQRAAPKTSAKAADRAKVTKEHDDDRDNTITSSLDLSNVSDASSVRVDDEDAAKPPPMV